MMKIDPLTQQPYYEEHPLDDYTVGIGRNSWYRLIPLSKCRNIFDKALDYKVHVYVCKCGNEYSIITDKDTYKRPYVCTKCENSGFFDVEHLDMYDDFLINIDAPPVCSIEEGTAFTRLFIKVPVSVDFARDKVVYEQKKIFEIQISLASRETVYNGWEKISTDVQASVEEHLLHYIGEYHLKKKMYDYEAIHMKQRTPPQQRKVISFFLKYSEFKHSEFISWVMDDDLYHHGGVQKTPQMFLEYIRNRTEKSVKRSLYKRYSEEMLTGKFHPINSYIICRIFDDSNYICKLLENHDFVFTYRNDYQSLTQLASSHIRLVEFLKENYSEKQMVTMFENMGEDPSYWEDSVSMFNSLYDIEQTSDHFEAPRANIEAIHNELVRCRYLVDSNYISVTFSYTKAQLKPCGPWKNQFQIVLPETSDELFDWAKKLHNCLYGYVTSVYEHATTVYGVKENGVLLYAIEIKKSGALVQMKRAYNANPEENVSKLLNAWYQCYFSSSDQKLQME